MPSPSSGSTTAPAIPSCSSSSALLHQQGFDWQAQFADFKYTEPNHAARSSSSAKHNGLGDFALSHPRRQQRPGAQGRARLVARLRRSRPTARGFDTDARRARQVSRPAQRHVLLRRALRRPESLARLRALHRRRDDVLARAVARHPRRRHASATGWSSSPSTPCPAPSPTTCGPTNTTRSPTRSRSACTANPGPPMARNPTSTASNPTSAAAPRTSIRAGRSSPQASGWPPPTVAWSPPLTRPVKSTPWQAVHQCTSWKRPTTRFAERCASPSIPPSRPHFPCVSESQPGQREQPSASTVNRSTMSDTAEFRNAHPHLEDWRCRRVGLPDAAEDHPAASTIRSRSSRGPLVFSLPIGEDWVKLRSRGMTADWQVFPSSEWNYALQSRRCPACHQRGGADRRRISLRAHRHFRQNARQRAKAPGLESGRRRG